MERCARGWSKGLVTITCYFIIALFEKPTNIPSQTIAARGRSERENMRIGSFVCWRGGGGGCLPLTWIGKGHGFARCSLVDRLTLLSVNASSKRQCHFAPSSTSFPFSLEYIHSFLRPHHGRADTSSASETLVQPQLFLTESKIFPNIRHRRRYLHPPLLGREVQRQLGRIERGWRGWELSSDQTKR